jgi:hypothetical protein
MPKAAIIARFAERSVKFLNKTAPAALDYAAEAASGCAERGGAARLTIRHDIDRSIYSGRCQSLMRRWPDTGSSKPETSSLIQKSELKQNCRSVVVK